MKLTSPNFENKSRIPVKFTADGEDINPELNIEDITDNVKSLTLIMDDPDAPVGNWVHWIVFNINPDIKKIKENSIPGIEGRNSWRRNNYGGPAPPIGTHRYFFKLYALDIELNLKEYRKEELEEAMGGHILDKAELIGLYGR